LEDSEHVIEVDWDGTLVERRKGDDDTIPRYLEFPVKDRASCNYMGVENLSYALYDDPLLVEDMVEHQAWMAYEMAKKVFDEGITLEWVWLWETCASTRDPSFRPNG